MFSFIADGACSRVGRDWPRQRRLCFTSPSSASPSLRSRGHFTEAVRVPGIMSTAPAELGNSGDKPPGGREEPGLFWAALGVGELSRTFPRLQKALKERKQASITTTIPE